MLGWEHRKMVYAALLIACTVIGLGAGPLVGVWSFLQVGVMIELANWLAQHRTDIRNRRG